MPLVQHGGEFARVAGSVTARTNAQKVPAYRVNGCWVLDHTAGQRRRVRQENRPNCAALAGKGFNQAQTPSRLLAKPSDQPAALGEYPLSIIPHGV